MVSLSRYITKEKSKFLVEAQYNFECIEFVVSRSRKGGIFRQLAVWLQRLIKRQEWAGNSADPCQQGREEMVKKMQKNK